MFERSKDAHDRETFLRQAQEAREKRQLEKRKQHSLLVIQSYTRGYLARKRFFDTVEYGDGICIASLLRQ